MLGWIAAQIVDAVHVSHGSGGWVLWIQPPRIAAGIGMVRGHVVTWLQVR
jgi:hypothetical protein